MALRWIATALLLVLLISTFSDLRTRIWGGADPIPQARSKEHAALLLAGTGASSGDVAAIEAVLATGHVPYSTVTSAQLNQMSEPEIRSYKLMIVPGGNFIEMAGALTPQTTTNVRKAVSNGMSYLGICAGAFLAADSSYYNSLHLTPGVKFHFYAAEASGHKAVVPITLPNAQVVDQYWEDGPQLSGWGMALAKYPDGTTAVAQGSLGRGLIILTGVHPEAPERWRWGMPFRTPTNVDNAYAQLLIDAALKKRALRHFE
jgi:glutamine amidotransferase-like uncharacterized protein